MSTFPRSPRVLKSGLALIDPTTSAVLRIIVLQYSPDSISRTLQIQGAGGEGGDRSEALRLKGPPVETIKLDAEIDATDQLEFAEPGDTVTQSGIFPQLAALETIIYPTSSELLSNNTLAQAGTLEIAPMETPLALFVWSRSRILPVRVTEFSVTEEAFDPNLNPIRAKVSLGLRVLSVFDVGFDHKGGNLFINYLQGKERLAAMSQGVIGALGVTGV